MTEITMEISQEILKITKNIIFLETVFWASQEHGKVIIPSA